jgi:hypothetical protein
VHYGCAQGRLSRTLWNLWKQKFDEMCARVERPLTCTHRAHM